MSRFQLRVQSIVLVIVEDKVTQNREDDERSLQSYILKNRENDEVISIWILQFIKEKSWVLL